VDNNAFTISWHSMPAADWTCYGDMLRVAMETHTRRGYELQDVLDILQNLGRAIIYCTLYQLLPTIVLLKENFNT
jgi:hypothetical protein